MPARSPPTLVLADASIDGSVLGSARRTRRRTTPLHDQSRPGRTHCLGGVSSPLRPLTPGRLPGGRSLPTQPPPRRASPTGSPFPRNASISEVFPPKNLRYSPRRNRQSRFSPDYDRVSPRQVTLRAPSAHSHASFSYRFEAVTTPHHLGRHHRQTAARLDAAAPHPRHDAPRADRSEGLPPPANSRARTASRPATTHAHRGPSRRVSLPAPRR